MRSWYDYARKINDAVVELGNTAYAHAKRHCPVLTGRLKRSITHTDIRDRAANTVTAKIWTDVPYAKNVEFGINRRIPKPFLGNALEYARTQAPVVFEIFLRGDLRK